MLFFYLKGGDSRSGTHIDRPDIGQDPLLLRKPCLLVVNLGSRSTFHSWFPHRPAIQRSVILLLGGLLCCCHSRVWALCELVLSIVVGRDCTHLFGVESRRGPSLAHIDGKPECHEQTPTSTLGSTLETRVFVFAPVKQLRGGIHPPSLPPFPPPSRAIAPRFAFSMP